jgi:hypothetical protein
MNQDKSRFRRNLIIGVLVKIGLLALLWFAVARPILMKKSDAGDESRHPVLALVQATQGENRGH